jgi:bifunctional ADP-heptose synthase (sugar kinase/adenylyltransferase)
VIPAYGSDEVTDVTGAGDTVIAVFTLGRIAGASFEDAARLANYAAGIAVTKAGTATVSQRELARAIREDLG